MGPVALIDDDALVLDNIPYRDRDLILSLLTPSIGLARGVLRGARGGKHPTAGATQILSLIHVVAFQGKHAEMASLRQVDLKMSSFPLSTDLTRSAAAAVVSELLTTFCPLGESAPRRFRLGIAALEALLSGTDPATVIAYVQFWCLALGGVLPRLGEAGLDESDLDFLLACRNEPMEAIHRTPPASTSRWLDSAIRSVAERPVRAWDFMRANVT
jgi:DNA repair protein RecO